MEPLRDLPALLRHLEPELRPGAYVFATVDRLPPGLRPIATLREDEGTSLVVERSAADRAGLDYAFEAAWITLRVRSALDAVGLTAAVAGALAAAGIACNVVAGAHHDHLFVPVAEAERALGVLRALADGSGA